MMQGAVPVRDPQAGVTLIEMLAVLVIVGIAAGVSLMGLRPDRNAGAEAEARRLSLMLELALDEAIIGGAPLALIWDRQGYRFAAWQPDRAVWAQAAQPLLAQRHDLVAPLALRREGVEGAEGGPVLIVADAGPVVVRFAFEAAGQGGAEAAGWRMQFDGFSAGISPVVAP